MEGLLTGESGLSSPTGARALNRHPDCGGLSRADCVASTCEALGNHATNHRIS
jgi:hypothetical protein